MTLDAPATPARSGRVPSWWICVGIVLVAATLRPAVVAVSPLLAQIQESERLSATAAGVLTALPVLCFGLLAPTAPLLARRLGIERALLTALALLAVGYLVRSSGTLTALYLGTVVAGSAIAIGNVLLPSLIKRDFAHRTGVMTGLYTMAISGGAALAAGFTVPIAQAAGLGWHGALLVWVGFVGVALVGWLPHTRSASRPTATTAPPAAGLWRDPLAWQVTAYMGLQSLGYFAVTAWLPAMLVDRGYTPVAGGFLLSLASVAGIAGATIAPVLATRWRQQRALAVGITAVTAIGLLGVFTVPGVEPVAVLLLGAGQSAALGLSLTLMALRAPDAGRAGQLSGMAQSIGYVVAATGPFAVGALHDLTAGWWAPLVLLVALLMVQGGAGLLAGRDRLVGGRSADTGVR